jgi:hypothetical protein
VLSTLFTFLLFVVGLLLLWRRTNRVRGLPQHPLTRQRSLILRTELPEVTTLVTQAMEAMGSKVISVDPDAGPVLGRTKWTWRSFGQYLQVDVRASDVGSWALEIRSWPTVDYAVMDWGAGKIVVDQFADELRHRCPAGTSVVPAESGQ